MNQYILYGIIFLILLALELVYFRVAADYNERNVYGRDRSVSLEIGPTTSGMGLSLRF